MDLKNFRSTLSNFMVLQLGILRDNYRVFSRYLKLFLLFKRAEVIATLSTTQSIQLNRPKVLVAIAHITSAEEASDREKGAVKIERLKETIDGILSSLSHCDITILISTLPNRHITSYLPEYQIDRIQVKEEPACDPMFIGYRIQDELIDKVEEFEWFLFVEDDIVIHDSYFLEKLEKFNRKSGYERAILFPNRYEMWQGTKRYIDLTILNSDRIWNDLTAVEIEGVKFAECVNPHSGCFCLSKHQMKIWMESKREWKNKDLGFGGSRESAVTYSLLECFSLYKPHQSNLHFFEVKHYDTKYSQLYPESSSYAFSPVESASKLTKGNAI